MGAPIIVAFEGLDRSGKDSVRNLFGIKTEYRYIAVPRFILSNAVYDLVFGRRDRTQEYMDLLTVMERQYGMLTIFIDTPPALCAARPGCQYTVDELRAHRRIFLRLMDWHGGLGENRLIVRADTLTIAEITDEVVLWVEGHI